MEKVVAKSKIAELDETKFHFSVALHHLRAMHSEIIPIEAVPTWSELLRYAEFMDHAFNPTFVWCSTCGTPVRCESGGECVMKISEERRKAQ